MKSQWYPRAELNRLQLGRLNATLVHAWRTVPFYRQHWPRLPVLTDLQQIVELPILTKSMVRTAGDQLNCENIPITQLISAKTGGSTGTALVVRFDRRCQQHRNAAALRSDSWAGWKPGDWVGALWGSPVLPKTPKQKLRNWLRERVLYLDTMRLDENSMNQFLEIMRAKPLDALFGHAHSLYILADYVQKTGAMVPPPHAIVSTSMMLIPSERAVIERAFGCAVTDRYGCEEVGLIAAQCETHAGLHVNAEHTLVEIVDGSGAPCAAGEIGRVVVTDLQNKGMPLIRYEAGDMSSWSMAPCSCGRGLPTLERIIGRQADCFVRTDGSLVAGVSLVERTLTAIAGIEQMQLVQESPTQLIAHVVRDPAVTPDPGRELAAALTRDLGTGINVAVHFVSRIPQESNGKYRFAIRRF